MTVGEAERLWDVAVPMRDGTILRSDLYLPEEGERGPYPAVVARTPYSKQHPVYVAGAQYLSRHGYACVLQDVRGRHDSEGTWVPFEHEGPDGYDTIEWVAAQRWCTGRVGTMGGSYGGWVQWALARERPPHLTTMVSTASCGAFFEELPYDGGCLMLVVLGWLNLVSGRVVQNAELVENWPDAFRHLPLRELPDVLGREMPLWSEWLEHSQLDNYWKDLRLDQDFARLDLPVLHVTGWFDDDQPGALYMHRGMTGSGAAHQSLVIGPWDHAGTRVPRQVTGGRDFGPGALYDVMDLHRRWFDQWLKRDHEPAMSASARLFLTGRDSWVDSPAFPPAHRSLKWYLDSNGRANTLAGDGRLGPDVPSGSAGFDEYAYDPNDPVPAVIDENFYSANVVETPLDHRFKHRRDDVLVYTSDPAEEDLTLVGHCEVRLYASTDGPDTDWFVALHDLAPTGASMILCDGRLRARFAESLQMPVLREAGRIYEYVVRTSAVGHVLRPGHRLRLTVTSSDFPVWDRNLNTGAPLADGTDMRIALNRIVHSAEFASMVVLPQVQPEALRPVEAHC